MSIEAEMFVPGTFENGWNFTKPVSMAGAETHTAAETHTGVETHQVPRRVGEQVETVATTKTLDEGDIGVIQRVTADAGVITLPATVVGYVYIIENGGADGTVLATVSPNASDKIMGNGFTSADNKDALNTKATAKKGDRIVLIGDGVNGWMVQEVVGIWARE